MDMFKKKSGCQLQQRKWEIVDSFEPFETKAYKEAIVKLLAYLWIQSSSYSTKTNMEPKNGDLEDDFLFQTDDFQIPCKFWGV